MGWATGSLIADKLYSIIIDQCGEEVIEELAPKIVDLFEAFDCDTIYESEWFYYVSEECVSCGERYFKYQVEDGICEDCRKEIE